MLLERVDKPEKGGVDVERGVATLLYSSIAFTVCMSGGRRRGRRSKVFLMTF